MTHLQISTSLLGLGIAAVILLLVRRGHLYVVHGLFWIVVACGAVLLGFWPGLIDRLAMLVGFGYPPALLLLCAAAALFIKALHTDIVNTRIERDVRKLNQQLAIYEMEVNRNLLPNERHGFSGSEDLKTNQIP